ncbi:MAG: hypothetical protein AAF721_14450 [Myxococcota bacterium]
MRKANIIRLSATENNAAALEAFLVAGGELVEKAEPATMRWHALTREDRPDELAIFDIFPNQAGRQAHFDGPVATALSERAGELVQGGWDGVLNGVANLVTLAEHDPELGGRTATKASYITLRAAPGKDAELRAFLVGGRDQVAATEPGTLFWTALESEDEPGHFAIFDLFADTSGRDAHFGGVVAKALAEQAAALVVGGWDDGVLANVTHFDVRTSVTRS